MRVRSVRERWRVRDALTAVLCGALLVGLACANSGSEPQENTLASKLAGEGRPAEDRARDAGRRPVDVMTFLEVAPGMTAIDLIAAGGYYTEVLSHAVGPDGYTYAQNVEYVLKMNGGVNERAMTARLAHDRLPNVERLDRDLSDLGLPPGSVDFAITALNFHDIYNGRGPKAADGFLASVYRLLKAGGVLGIIDHSGGRSADDKQLHRIDENLVVGAAERAGFEVEATSDLLRNPGDNRMQGVFAPHLRGHTDRFILRLRK
jgi:predicted methyltransferase